MAFDPKEVKKVVDIAKYISTGVKKLKDIPNAIVQMVKEFMAKRAAMSAVAKAAAYVGGYVVLACLIIGAIMLLLQGLMEFIAALLAGLEAAKTNWNFLWAGRSSRVDEEMIAQAREELEKMGIDFKEKGYVGTEYVDSDDYKDSGLTFPLTIGSYTLTSDDVTAEQKSTITASPSDSKGKVKQISAYMEALEQALLNNGIDEGKRLTKKDGDDTVYYVDDGADNTNLDQMYEKYMKIKDSCSNFYIKKYLEGQEYTTMNENPWTLDGSDKGSIEVDKDSSFDTDTGFWQELFHIFTGSYSVYSPQLKSGEGAIVDENEVKKTSDGRIHFYVKIRDEQDTTRDPDITDEVQNITMLWQYPLSFHTATFMPDIGAKVSYLAKHHKIEITLFGSDATVIDQDGKEKHFENPPGGRGSFTGMAGAFFCSGSMQGENGNRPWPPVYHT